MIYISSHTKGIQASPLPQSVGLVCFGEDTKVLTRCCTDFLNLKQMISEYSFCTLQGNFCCILLWEIDRLESKHGSKRPPSSVPTLTHFPESKCVGLRREVDIGYTCPFLKKEYFCCNWINQFTSSEMKTSPNIYLNCLRVL